MKKVKYGILMIRNGVPMIQWIAPNEIRQTKKMIRNFFNKNTYPTLIKVYLTKNKDISTKMSFKSTGNIWLKLVKATPQESWIK